MELSASTQPRPTEGSTPPLALRRAESADKAFVFSTWLKGYHSQRRPRGADKEFYGYWEPRLIQLLEDPHTQLWVLCATQNPNHIAGWACFTRVGDKAAIHWAHIKGKPAGYRGLGLFWKLMGAGGIDRHTSVVYTFPCKRAAAICSRFRESDEYPIEEFLA